MIQYARCDELKERIDSYRPFPKETLASLKNYYKISLTYSSNALEGNSLTESEIRIVIENGLTINGKPLRDIYETVGHAKAYDYLYTISARSPLKLSHIRMLHKLFYSMIDETQAGKFRKNRVFISGSSYSLPAPAEVPHLMDEFIVWFNEFEHKLHPVEFAALVHLKFVFIHPFIDGNGRVARLLMNLALLRQGYTIAVIPPIMRGEYIQTLEIAHTNTQPFHEFIVRRVIETQKELLRLMSDDRVNSVNESVISYNDSVNPIYSIIQKYPGINTPKIADLVGKSIPTVSRNIAELKKGGLIEFRGAPKNGGYYIISTIKT